MGHGKGAHAILMIVAPKSGEATFGGKGKRSAPKSEKKAEREVEKKEARR